MRPRLRPLHVRVIPGPVGPLLARPQSAAVPALPATDAGCEEVAARFRALSEPMRLKILRRLARGEASVGEVLAEVGGTQANVSKHLAVLHARAIVERRKVRTRVVYRIADPRLLAVCSAVCEGVARDARERAEALSGNRKAS